MMTWVERKVATSLVSDFPSATIDEALIAFQNSEGLKPGHWIDNQLYLAKVFVVVNSLSVAYLYVQSAVQVSATASCCGGELFTYI